MTAGGNANKYSGKGPASAGNGNRGECQILKAVGSYPDGNRYPEYDM